MQTSLLLIGSGHYGQLIQSALQDLPFEVTVLDGRETSSEVIAAHPASYVVIATPNFTHYDLVKACLECKKHVLCEKPLALTNQEVTDLYALAEQHEVRLSVGFVLPNHPFYQWIKEVAPDLGGLTSIEVYNHATEGELEPAWYWNREQSGGWFMVAEIHWLQLYYWLTGSPELQAFGSEMASPRTTQTLTSLKENGHHRLTVQHRLDMTQQTHWTKVELFFENGVQMVIDDWVPRSLRISDSSLNPTFPAWITKQGAEYSDTRSRDETYRQFIRDNILDLVEARPQDQLPIRLAHQSALEAQQNADSKPKH